MQNASRKKSERPRIKDLDKDELPLSSRKSQDVTKGVSTPRNFMQKTTPSDIYGKKKQNLLQAPKKSSTVSSSGKARNVSPMKEFLRSTPSSVSHASIRSSSKMAPDKKSETNAIGLSARKSTPRTVKAQAPSNVTVNSPIIKRKLNLTKEKSNISIKSEINDATKNMTSINAGKSNSNMADMFTRQRSKTRTLDEDEVKVFKSDMVDNNAEMKNLSRRLSAKPKSFYVDLNGQPNADKDKSSEEEVSYEDDFESYESDFDSYHSEHQSNENSNASDEDRSSEDPRKESKTANEIDSAEELNTKDSKDEEKMLDSGSYDLRETQRSAQRNKSAMLDFILEGSEDAEKKASLTDEGFQDMSASSAVSSIKTLHIDILDRPLFVDFNTNKRNRRKRRIFERLRRRAEDILSMVTLHEMKFTLFEMKPVPYDTFMAAFGRSNCSQVSVQTLEDAITVESQTDEVSTDTKWTQHPVKFSIHDICLNTENTMTVSKDDLAKRFTDLLNPVKGNHEDGDKTYGRDPLRIYMEQKNGVGTDRIQASDDYTTKLKSTDFNVKRLKKFLARSECRISRILNMNAGNTDMSGAMKTTKLPFSKSYVVVPTDKAKGSFCIDSKVTNVFVSETRSNFIVTIHENGSGDSSVPKSILCLWDLSLNLQKPLKTLVATDYVAMGKFRGGSDGILIVSLVDGTVHLWDLSEQAGWIHDNTGTKKTVETETDIDKEKITHIELDREWNRVHSNIKTIKEDICLMQSSAYTTSGNNIVKNHTCDGIVGLEFVGEAQINYIQDGERKIIAQICALQRTGILTLWSVVQDRQKYSTKDIGKAFWSKLLLEKVQTLDLSESLEVHMQNTALLNDSISFNLNAAKKRMSVKWREKQMSLSSDRLSADIRRPRSARKRVLPLRDGTRNNWETGLVCYDLRIVRRDGSDQFLIAKNCGEILSCTRYAGLFKIKRFLIANDASSVTCLEVSHNGLPYILAATDAGAVSLCSIQDMRVLLTLDCRNTPSTSSEKFHSDVKGRYVGTTRITTSTFGQGQDEKMTITSLIWSSGNPFEVGALLGDGALVAWRLTSSDIAARRVEAVATKCTTSPDTLALITPQNEVQIHRLKSEVKDNIELFKKYTSLL